MGARILSVLVLATVATAGGAAARAATPGAGSATPGPAASAAALAVRIVLPSGRVIGSAAPAGGPGGGTAASASFSYPRDGSVIVTGETEAATRTREARTAAASASAGASNISIFEGEITADSASAHASAATSARAAGGGFGASGVAHLQALGRPHLYGKALLSDWGYLTISTHTVDRSAAAGVKSYDGVSVALQVELTAPHDGLPAGTEIEVGYAQAQAQTAPAVSPGLGPLPGDQPQLLPPTSGPLLGVPQIAEPPLAAGPYDFPVYGSSSYQDDYGDARQNVTWQHGIDILGQLGQPLVAVADGTLYSVGWNHASGNRLWLRDRQGNEFLYSHLSAFSTLTRNGAHIRAGQVIGFMGDTGYADGLATHLHFELHPVSMLFVGPDGAVDPAPYFTGWHRIANLAFPVETGWAPKVPGTIAAPRPGAVLIGSTDISSADGLDPASLRRVLRPVANG